jgi:DNA polymerase (family 10)
MPGIGPQRARMLQKGLGIRTLADLRCAASGGRLVSIRGIGLKTQQRIQDALAAQPQAERRFALPMALQMAAARLATLLKEPGVSKALTAGSLRRRRDTVGDLDLVVAATPANTVTHRFAQTEDVASVIAKGPTRASIMLTNGLQIDLRVVAPASFGAALLYFTGSKAHNIALRRRAQDAGLKLNEYGLFRARRSIAGKTEASVYKALGLPFIEPELREDRGEIEAGLAHQLPSLVTLDDLRGDLHARTKGSDGRDMLDALTAAARARGWQYMAATEPSPWIAPGHGVDAGALARQIDRIDEFNASVDGFTVLKGVDVEILEDGRLQLPLELLRRLDFVVGSIRQGFDLSLPRQTDRLLRAMDHPCFSIVAHPTGRVIGVRAACAIDMQRVIRQARQRGCFMELDADPMRLDLDDVACRMARAEGVRVSIASNALSALDFDNLSFGIGQARRGWLEPRDVLNACSLEALRPLLATTMGKPEPPKLPARSPVGAAMPFA